MPLSPGTRLGAHEVVAKIGEGGMGEVYRARDSRLGRDVAIKVLPDLFASDPDRLARFQREAMVLAALNHPNIAQVYGLEDAGGVRALIMELVEGPTLADRIGSGSLAIDDALSIARQMAEALEAAHAAGIIHRDLKPANIKVKADETVKVLDFGLAKALGPAVTPDASDSMSPTLTAHATQAGVILGTAAYMSPEQARGKAVDTRADIWAFGAVLFEMLAGSRPFEGDEVSDTLASILKTEPAWQRLPSEVPAAVRRLLRRCLQKDPRARLQHIGDARLDIEEAQQGPSPEREVPLSSSRRIRFAWASAIGFAAAAAMVAAFAVYRRSPASPELPEMRLEVSMPQGGSHFAISPDGRMIAFSTLDSQRRQIWVRSLDDPSPRPLAGTEGSEYPFWSPDGRSIGFFANNKLKRVDLEGGEPQLLADVLTPAGGTWNRDGTILFVPNDSAGVAAVPASGGEARLVTPRREPHLATRLPQFLPDGRHFLFFVARGGEPAGVYVGELGSDSIRRILTADRPAVYGSGHVWFVRERDIHAQRFDPSTLTLSGPVSRVAENVGLGLVVAHLSASAAGPIAYRTASEAQSPSRRGLIWFDRSGKELGRVGEEGGFASNPSISADGRYLVMQRTVQENIDIWLVDLLRNATSRLTVQPGIDSLPIWSPDGLRVAFSRAASTDRSGIAVLRINRASEPEVVLGAYSPVGGSPADPLDSVKIACDWSPDGQHILYKQVDPRLGSTDLWVVPLSSSDKPVQVVATPADERDGQFSPDGKWIAYESDESGRPQIYVQPFPGPGPKVPISTGGGSQVRWRRDGKELFYVAPDDTLMAVPFDPAGRSDVGTPTPLFKTSIAPIRTISRQQYVVSPDGQRFLIVTTDASPAMPVTLLLNWKGASP